MRRARGARVGRRLSSLPSRAPRVAHRGPRAGVSPFGDAKAPALAGEEGVSERCGRVGNGSILERGGRGRERTCRSSRPGASPRQQARRRWRRRPRRRRPARRRPGEGSGEASGGAVRPWQAWRRRVEVDSETGGREWGATDRRASTWPPARARAQFAAVLPFARGGPTGGKPRPAAARAHGVACSGAAQVVTPAALARYSRAASAAELTLLRRSWRGAAARAPAAAAAGSSREEDAGAQTRRARGAASEEQR